MADARYLALGDSSNSTDWSDTDLKRSLNKYLHQANEIGIQAGGASLAFGEIVTIDTVANQREYLLTDTGVNLKRVYTVFIKPKAGENYQKSTVVFPENIPDPTNYLPSKPQHYFLEDSIFIYYNTPVIELSEGILLYGQTDITELTNDTDIPQVPEFAQDYAVLGANADFKDAHKQFNDAVLYRNRMIELEQRIIKSYNNRTGARHNAGVMSEDYT